MTKKRRVPLVMIALVLGVGILTAALWGKKSSAGDYITAKVERGTVEVTVSATGTVQAVTTVQVGSQVSGTVSWLGADFKSRVKKGQLVAKLDPAIFQAQLDTQKANLLNAQAAARSAETDINNQKANLLAAQANQEAARVARDDAMDIVKRDKELLNVISGRDLEAAQAQAKGAAARYEQATAQIGQAQAALEASKAKLEQAKAAVQQAKAQVDLAQVNLDHTMISSPIDGVVVSRSIDVGQTVAASLQAPTLFTIANDLTNMQVLASVDEADVGQIHEGITANSTVDAYPGLTFSGRITQIRLNAQTQQNVVTYTTVINVQNPDEKLLPGMTANITVSVAHKDDVLTVPNAALRFKPNLTDKEQQDLKDQMDARRRQYEAERQAGGTQPKGEGQAGQPKPEGTAAERPARAARPDAAQAGSNPPAAGQAGSNLPAAGQAGSKGSGMAGADGGQRRQGQVIWVLTAEKKLEPRFVRVGITNGRVTEVSGNDIHEGDQVVVGQNDSTSGNRPQTTTPPFGGRPGFGPGPRR